jgi:hypothetical protein
MGPPSRDQVMLGIGSPVNPQDKATLVLGSSLTRAGPAGVAVGASVQGGREGGREGGVCQG